MGKIKKALFVFLGLTLVAALTDTWLFRYSVPDWEPTFVSTSPDGRFSASVYYNPGIFPLPSGMHPRGSSGTVVLRENKTGKVIQREVIKGPIYDESIVIWTQDEKEIIVMNVGVWNLPAPEPEK